MTVVIGGAVVFPAIIARHMRKQGLGLRDLPRVLAAIARELPRVGGRSIPW